MSSVFEKEIHYIKTSMKKSDISEDEYTTIINSIGLEFEQIGVTLGISSHEIQAIRYQFPYNLKKCCSAIIKEKFLKNNDLEVKDLFEALRSNKRHDLNSVLIGAAERKMKQKEDYSFLL